MKLRRVQKAVREVDDYIDILSEHRLGAYAAQAAFFMVLSIFPFLLFSLSLVHYLPVKEEQIMWLAEEYLSDVIFRWLRPIIKEVFESNVSVLTFSVITVIWSASKGFRSTCDGLDSVNGVLQSRSYWKTYVKGITYAVSLALIVVICVVVMIFGPQIQKIIETYVPPLAMVAALLVSFRALILLVVLGLLFTWIYKFLPQKKLTFRSQFPGGLLCAVGWVVFSYFLSLYVERFNGFSMYGSLTAIVLFMFWMYCCYYIMFICAEVNVFLTATKKREQKLREE